MRMRVTFTNNSLTEVNVCYALRLKINTVHTKSVLAGICELL